VTGRLPRPCPNGARSFPRLRGPFLRLEGSPPRNLSPPLCAAVLLAATLPARTVIRPLPFSAITGFNQGGVEIARRRGRRVILTQGRELVGIRDDRFVLAPKPGEKGKPSSPIFLSPRENRGLRMDLGALISRTNRILLRKR